MLFRFAATLLALATLPLPALSADYAVGIRTTTTVTVETSTVPACDNTSVINKIIGLQDWAERNTWQDGLLITAVHSTRQSYPGTRFISMIEHRHCMAQAELTGGRSDRLYYVISAGQGVAGIGWGVEFCMPRHDPWRVYDADCRVLK